LVRGKIPDAASDLATKRVQMKQFFRDSRTYEGTCATTGPMRCLRGVSTGGQVPMCDAALAGTDPRGC